jgi:hypothetical protein
MAGIALRQLRRCPTAVATHRLLRCCCLIRYLVQIEEKLALVSRQLFEMFGGPLRRFSVQRAFDVVALKSKHLANPHDDAAQ